MKLGLNVAYWGLGLSADEQLELVREAEQLGYDSVWAAEAYGSDAATVLAWLAGQTEKINLGSAIFQMPARSPAMAAMTDFVKGSVSAEEMIRPEDIAESVRMLLHLSPTCVIPEIIYHRPGEGL